MPARLLTQRDAPASAAGSPADPTTRLLRRLALAFFVGGLLVYVVPRALVRLVDGDGGERLGALVALLFWTWLTWRMVVLVRAGHAGAIRSYWRTNALGWTAFLVVYAGLEVADALDGALDVRSLPFTGFVLFLAVSSWVAARRARDQHPRGEPPLAAE